MLCYCVDPFGLLHGPVDYYFLKHAHESIGDNIDCIALKSMCFYM